MKFTAEQIAQMTGGAIEGNPQAAVWDFAKIEEGHAGALSFLSNPKYEQFIYTTQSSIVLVSRDFVAQKPVAATLIRVDDPYVTLSALLQMVSAQLNPRRRGIEPGAVIAEGVSVPDDSYVGALAYIDKDVTIGRDVNIYPQAYIGHNVTIGDGTTIYPGARIYHGCRIGRNCVIHSNAVIGSDGFGFAPTADGEFEKIPQLGIVEIGDNVEIGANTTIDRAVMGATKIEDGVKLDNLVQIAHNVVVGTNTVMAAQCGIAGSTHIGSNCMFGGQVGIAGHIVVGNNVKLGAQTGIPNSVADNAVLMGTPGIPARNWAKNQVYFKRLPDMEKDIASLKQQIKK